VEGTQDAVLNMEPILLGYFAKQRAATASDLHIPATVNEIASVSGCIARKPDDWINHWKHNNWFVFDSPQDALSVAEGVRDVRLYAYSVLPVEFTPEGEHEFSIVGVAPTPLSDEFEQLGFDVASRSVAPEFECSPLSCNGLAGEVAVNEFCLIGSLAEALSFARRCAIEQPEPGIYFVIGIHASRVLLNL
jgi:hypothetical protein